MEEEIDTTLPTNHNLKCHICGENQFDERDGFYYCQECGTKHEQFRLVEVVRDDEFNQDTLKTRKQKIQVAKVEKPQLTSWECYNYILRGYVEEMISFGAKEELKLMTLQVWAAYLRRMHVAFFNRKHADLPKLGIKYLENDASAIYNHSQQARKKRRRSSDTNCTSGDDSRSAKDFRKSKRKLDESNYSITSATSGGSGLTSSTSANSNRAIKIGFSAKARAFYKRKMPIKHLEKHAADAEGLLKCHKQPKAREINRSDYNLMLVNIKQIYCVLGIALNLIDDNIQLSDLVRFINEGHVGNSNVLQYFPENIANNGKQMLKKINFYKCPEKYSDKALRDHIGLICKNIGIRSPKTPDIVKLVRRYVMELCLPSQIADYIERLINLFPPQFKTRAVGHYSGFEARAMAYIIFTLKLFYGLDDSKEQRISSASQKLNAKIERFNCEKSEKQPLLFVWNDWVEYIEMRKIIISHFNTSFCEQYKQCQSTKLLLKQMTEEMQRSEETDSLLNGTPENPIMREKLKIFRSLFEKFQEKDTNDAKDKPPLRIDFRPSLTPAFSYLKSILLVCDTETNLNSLIDIKIPDFMRIDHSKRDINSYLQVKPLIGYFQKHKLNLNVHSISTNKHKNYVGVFRSPVNNNRTSGKLQKAVFDVTDEEWATITEKNVILSTEDLQFITEFTTYNERTLHQKKKPKQYTLFNPNMEYDLTMTSRDVNEESNNNKVSKSKEFLNNSSNRQKKNVEEIQSTHSFELFTEDNMEPLDNKDFITKPRRNLESTDLFEGISDEESVLKDDDEEIITKDSQTILVKDNDSLSKDQGLPSISVDSISIHEEFIKLEPVSPNCLDKSNQQQNKSKAKRSNELKMYISNMDCWMIFGNLFIMTKSHKSQLQDKFPRSFNWLLETCAQTISVEWPAVYEQLLCIELLFCLGINDPSTIQNYIYIKNNQKFKEIQQIVKSYREIW